MRYSTQNAINKYINACLDTDWISREAYKFQFANDVHNCHRMLHKGDPVYSIKDLKKMIMQNASQRL